VRRRHYEEDSEHRDRWLVSYSDFITLLLGFFIVMYSVSQVNEGKYRVLSNSLQDNFNQVGGPVIEQHTLEPDQKGEITRSEKAFDTEFYENHSAFIMGEGGYGPEAVKAEMMLEDISKVVISAFNDLMKDELITLNTTGEWLELQIQNSILFDSGGIALTPRAKQLFKELAFVLKGFNHEIRIAGYTDNKPINSTLYPSNWELSAARSAAVVRLLVEYGIDPKRMSAVGYGEFQPLGDNANEDNRAKNRRVVLLVSRTEMKDPDVVGGINEEKLYEEIDSPLIQFEWDDDNKESEEIPTDIEGVKTIKLKDGGYRFTNEAKKSESKKKLNQGLKESTVEPKKK